MKPWPSGAKMNWPTRAGRRAEAEAERAHRGRQQPREGRHHEQEGGAGDAEADQHAGGQLQRHRVPLCAISTRPSA